MPIKHFLVSAALGNSEYSNMSTSLDGVLVYHRVIVALNSLVLICNLVGERHSESFKSVLPKNTTQ